jgi:Concanavalin A-like lectin/glucanases superfamily/PKD domain/Secretion system C-terminal sorting domain/Bacterial Ig domain
VKRVFYLVTFAASLPLFTFRFMRSKIYLFRLTGMTNLLRRQLHALCIIAIVSLSSSIGHAQTYYNVSNLSGTSTEGGVTVTVAGFGTATSYNCGLAAPYWTGSAVGGYTWSFSSPVQSVAIHIDAQDAGDDCSFTINGTSYSINASQISSYTPTCFGSGAASAVGGDLVNTGGGDNATYLVITPGYAINSFSMSCLGGGNGVTNDFNFAITASSNTPPSFVNGSTQTLTLCANTATDISTMLDVTDPDNGQTETWSIFTTPTNGIATVAYTTTSTGGTLVPAGLSYAPNPGFSGLDTFSVMVNDGNGGNAATTIYVTVNPTPSAAYAPSPSSVCLGNSVSFTSAAPLCSGDALYFNGSANAAGPVPTLAVNNVTMEAWVKWDGTGGAVQVMLLNGSTTSSGYCLFHNGGQVEVVLGGISIMYSGYYLTPGVWTHLAMTGDASNNWSLYVNGVYTPLSPSSAATGPASSGFYVGSDELGAENFTGSVDNVMVWTTVRTAAQIQSDMMACNVMPQTNLVGYWKFDEGAGTTTADASGHGNTLTLNSAGWVPATGETLSTYAWNFGDGGTAAVASVAHTYTATGTYSTSLIVTNSLGCTATNTANVTVNPNPDPISGTTVVCTGLTTSLGGTPSGGSWSSSNAAQGSVDASGGVVAGISAGTPTISYTLSTGCYAVTTVTVNQTPLLTSLLSTSTCNGVQFNYVGTANTDPGTVYSWSRDSVDGISNAAGEGLDTISETLLNTTPYPVAVTYVYDMSANGCNNSENVVVTVNPTPMLNSGLTAASICDSTLFSYSPSSLTPGTYFSWSRDTIAGIANGSNVGTGNVNETLVNTTAAPVQVNYTYTLYAACSNTQTVSVTVNPLPTLTSALTAAICDSTSFMYTSTSTTSPISFTWSRDSVAGISNSSASGADPINEVLQNTTPDPVAVTYIDTLSAYGCMNTEMITVTVNPKPVLETTLTPPSICDSTLFGYAPSSATMGTAFTWSRAALTGISNPAASDSGNIAEVLMNTTPDSIVVVYVDTLKANGCMNTQNVMVTVYPRPMLSTSLFPAAICDSQVFDYPAASATPATTLAWTRAYVPGILETASGGFNDPFEQLINTTNVNVAAVYVYTLTAYGCSNIQSVTDTVHPLPVLTSALSQSVCSGALFAYAPTSEVTGTTYTWTRAAVAGLTPSTGAGTGHINETLSDSSNTTAITATYHFTLMANGCSHPENISLTVLPRPVMPQITTYPPSSLCSGTMYQNFGTAMQEPAGIEYGWTATNATVWASGQGHQYALVNFDQPGNAEVMLTTTLSGSQCAVTSSYAVNVGSTASPDMQVIYFNGQLICMRNDMDTYQWGYDDATTLDSTLIPGEINFNYFISGLDNVHRYYWVITTKDGCMQKTYYNEPTSVANVNTDGAMDVKVYPNPASAYIDVAVETTVEGKYTADLIDLLGQRINTTTLTDRKGVFDVKELPAGCYMVVTYREGVKIASTRFIKN